jgi:DUF2892 family protein
MPDLRCNSHRIGSSNSVYVKLKSFIMKKNMGSEDKMIRVIIAVVIGILYYAGIITGTLGIVALVLAGVFVATSLVSFCPAYAPFGLSTCRNKQAD